MKRQCGKRSVVSGQWPVAGGQWSVASGRWSVAGGRWSRGQRPASSEQRTEQRTANSRQ